MTGDNQARRKTKLSNGLLALLLAAVAIAAYALIALKIKNGV